MRIEFDPLNREEATAVRLFLDAQSQGTDLPGDRRFTLFRDEPSANIIRITDEALNSANIVSDDESLPETDSAGMPWDARIHSTPAKINADGTWRAKRGVKAEEIEAVKDELAARTSDMDEYATEDLSAQFAEETVIEAPPSPPAPTPPPAPVTTEPPAPAPTGGEPAFLDVMKAITAAQKDGKITTDKVKELAAAVGAGDSTMGLNGKDNGPMRAAFMALLTEVVG